jgi:hypothetical protein
MISLKVPAFIAVIEGFVTLQDIVKKAFSQPEGDSC